MESCNDRLLQLIECIESTQNEVKKKMIASSAFHDAPKSPRAMRTRKNRDAMMLHWCESGAAMVFARAI
jgi:hypothetical protein